MKRPAMKSRPRAAARRHKIEKREAADWQKRLEERSDEVAELIWHCRIGGTRYAIRKALGPQPLKEGRRPFGIPDAWSKEEKRNG